MTRRQLAPKGVVIMGMRKELPAVGTDQLLEVITPEVPDQFINELLPRRKGVGRRCCFSAGQLWRVHLLAMLTGTHSYNGIVRLLPERRSWRRFAHLSHRERTPDVRMLHEFRCRAGVSGLRAINDHLVMKLLKHLRAGQKTVGVIDATDLPAATADKKKMDENGRPSERAWGRARSSRATHAFSSAIRNTPCGYGLTVMRPQFSWFQWLVGSRRPMCQRAICSSRAFGIAGVVLPGARTLSWVISATFMARPNARFERLGEWLSSRK
jgi:hypothetical protein